MIASVYPLLATVAGTTLFRETAVSPDGRWLAWTVMLAGGNSGIRVLDLSQPGAASRRVEEENAQSPAFSPDGRHIAFLSDKDKPGQRELYVQPVGGGAPRKLTAINGSLETPRWSPDGARIALLYIGNAPREPGPTEPGARETGAIGQNIYEQRLAVIDAGGGPMRPVTPADTYVYEYDWAPDAASLAYTASKGSGDNNWALAQLFTVTLSSGKINRILKPDFQIANPRWSPDGKRIALIGGLMADKVALGGDIYSLDAAGGAVECLTPNRKSSPSWLHWLPSGQILFAETVDGSTALATLNPSGKAVSILWEGDETLKSGDETIAVSKDGRTIASVRSSWTMPPEVWSLTQSFILNRDREGAVRKSRNRILLRKVAGGEWTRRTHLNESLKPRWGNVEKVHWRSDDFNIQGWLVYPLDFDPAKKYPMVTSVHGGPAWAEKPAWPAGHFDLCTLSAQGYFVLLPNARGSYGAGESFTRAVVRDFGFGDLRDIMTGVDAMIATHPIDPNRLGIAGWSYGGFMTMWAVTQTKRFRAAVAGAGIANWQSYYGQNRIDKWMLPYFGASVYDDPDVYAKRSPINFIKNVETPTLVLVGDSDAECPAPQSREFWHALSTLGIKTELVIYPGEGHAIRKPENKEDILRRTVAWFSQNL